MDGLRDLARSSLFSVSFCSRPDDQFTTLSIARTANGFDTKVASLSRAELRNFFKCGSEIAPAGPSATCYTLKLACIPADGFGQIYVDLSDFQNLLQTMELDPWIEHLIRSRSYGFHHSGRPGVDSVASYFLGTTFLWTVWTCRRQESGSFVTRCLVFGSKHVTFPRDFVQPNGLSGHLAAFAKESHSALYLPFVLAINALRWREGALMRSLNTVRGVESKTGHGSWGAGRFTAERDSIPALTARLGSELNTVSNTTRHLSFVEAILDHLDHLEQQDGETESSEAVRASDRSILCAARILRQQCSSAQAQCAYLELRIRSQSSVLFALLTHEDSNINIQIADASRDLAEAARRDGLSMKTIAVLTMAFLPATFFAALFSVPSLGWDQPDKFALYWACTIPVTVATFALWAAFTQRQSIRDMVESIRGKDPNRRKGRTVLVAGDDLA